MYPFFCPLVYDNLFQHKQSMPKYPLLVHIKKKQVEVDNIYFSRFQICRSMNMIKVTRSNILVTSNGSKIWQMLKFSDM